MIRAAIYARFSSDLQNDRSIGDQVALCCDYAARKGYVVARVYDDAAASGASIHGRAGMQRLITEADTRSFDVLLCESMSRIGRDQEDRAFIRKRLKFFDIHIETPGEGVVSNIVDGVRAVLDSEALEDLKRHTRRGMRGRINEGKSAGGLTYGYAPGPTKGSRIVLADEAAIVRRIFAEYLDGRSPRAIAERLNIEGIRGPRGGAWLQSAINGNPKRQSGILSNALYDGRMVWNRVTMRKDPRTGRRVSRVNPPAEWIVKEMPGLRIVDAETFIKVQDLKAERGRQRPEQSHRPRHLLAGLLRCGCCGGSMAINNGGHAGRRISCARRKEGGLCEHARTYRLSEIEARVVEGLKAQLKDPRGIQRYLETYRAERKRLAGATAAKRMAAEKGLAQATREIGRIVDAIAAGTILETEARERMAPLRQRREACEADLGAITAEPNIVALHPATIATYLRSIDELGETLTRRHVEGHESVGIALRELLVGIVITPAMTGPKIEVKGRLAALIGKSLPPDGDVAPRTAVAGTRNHRSRNVETAVFAFAA